MEVIFLRGNDTYIGGDPDKLLSLSKEISRRSWGGVSVNHSEVPNALKVDELNGGNIRVLTLPTNVENEDELFS